MNQHAKVLVIDDEPIIARLYTEVANSVGFTTIPPVGNIAAFASTLLSEEIDIAVLDIMLNGTNALDTLRSIRKRSWKTKVICVTGFHDKVFAQRALELGCEAVVWKKSLGTLELQIALRRVAAGGTFLSPEIRHLDTRSHCELLRPLTVRQSIVLDHLRRWQPQRVIATAIDSTAVGVYRTVGRIKHNLGFERRVGRARWPLVRLAGVDRAVAELFPE